LKDDITDDLIQFYESNEFRYLNSFPNHRNEFEVYLKEQDYYLFGILDKLIIDKEKIIIVDYKSNNIKENEIISNAEKYIPQLKFYAYIISRFFSDKKPIECRIIFIKHPEKPFIFPYNKTSDGEINAGIKLMVSAIRSNNYSLNLSNCNDCIFTDDHSRCVKISSELN
jgi:DNA-directed RNA polymerase subunit L